MARVVRVPVDRAAPAEAEGREADNAGPAFRDATRGRAMRGNATVASERAGSAGTVPSAPLTARSSRVAPVPMYGTRSDITPTTASIQRIRLRAKVAQAPSAERTGP